MLHTPSGFLALSFVQFGTLLLNGQRRFARYRLASLLWSVIGKPKTSARGCLGEVCDMRCSVVSQCRFDKPAVAHKTERPGLPPFALAGGNLVNGGKHPPPAPPMEGSDVGGKPQS